MPQKQANNGSLTSPVAGIARHTCTATCNARHAAEIIFGVHRITYPEELSMTYNQIRTRSNLHLHLHSFVAHTCLASSHCTIHWAVP